MTRPDDPPRPRGLDAVLRPRSVAVIGASRTRGSIGAEVFHNLVRNGFQGPVYPVNPTAEVVQSVRAYRSIADVPGPVDLAVVIVPAAGVLEVIEQCGAAGVGAAVVISAGFRETGDEGTERERAVLAAARRHGMRLVGPNCLGVLNTEESVRLDATFAPTYPPAGGVALMSQSGALGLVILEYAESLNLGISHFVSAGNKADVSGNDLLAFWGEEPGTRVVLLYLESFGNPRRFTQIARRVSRRKPVIAVKSGRTGAGQRAASSHTGALAGSDVAVDALLLQSGVLRTDTIEEMFDVAVLLANQPVPRGPRVAILTNAGGPAIMASDACESHGLVLPELAPDTTAALRAFLPPEASVRNPVDMIASGTAASFERALPLLLADPGVDAVLAIYVPPIVTRPRDVAQGIVAGTAKGIAQLAARGEAAKPVLTCFMGSHGVPEGLRSLREGQLPSYPFPESAAIALARAVEYGRWLARPPGAEIRFDDADPARSARVLRPRAGNGEGRRWLDPAEVRELLSAWGIRLPEQRTAANPDAAAAAGEALGWPVAVKLASETITHKSDVGGVVLNVRNAAEARAAFGAIAGRLEAIGRRGEMDGVTIQPMVTDGVEAIVGVTADPTFGPLIMFGLGGVHVELLRDVAFRVQPLTDLDAREMVRGVRGFPLLDGYRGAPAADVPALEELLLRVSQLVGTHPEILEMDLNPVKVLPAGRGCLAVDARVAVRTS